MVRRANEITAKKSAALEARGEAQANRNTAKNLKDLGVDYEIISKSTGLSMEEIAAL